MSCKDYVSRLEGALRKLTAKSTDGTVMYHGWAASWIPESHTTNATDIQRCLVCSALANLPDEWQAEQIRLISRQRDDWRARALAAEAIIQSKRRERT